MKVLLINGSPKKNGNTFLALSEVPTALNNNGVETESISIGAKAVQGCITCQKCFELGRCVFKDDLYNSLSESRKDADGVVVGTRSTMQSLTVRFVPYSTGCFILPLSSWNISLPHPLPCVDAGEQLPHSTA